MATLIFTDQENGEVGATKNQRRLPSVSSKVFSEGTQVNTPLPKKTIGTSPATSHSVRKALGNIAEKSAGLESCDAVAEEEWPEIENMFSFDPEDFESYDLPEEYKLSNINLRGVPLMIFERTYDKYVNMVPSPVKTEEFSQESNLLQATADFLATLDEIIIDMPPPL
ncbi:Pttg1 [Columba livia]|nr:Pttg1 [Columba livia]